MQVSWHDLAHFIKMTARWQHTHANAFASLLKLYVFFMFCNQILLKKQLWSACLNMHLYNQKELIVHDSYILLL